MSLESLFDSWTNQEAPAATDTAYSVGLSPDDTARIRVLVDLDAEHIITDLISTSLDELEAANGQET